MLALLGAAGPAAAQFADPLGLIASGGLMPFVSNDGSVTITEFASPVNCLGAPATCPFDDFHLVFFTDACTRTVSVNLPMSTNDVEVISTLALSSGFIRGLIAFANTGGVGVEFAPLDWPVFARAHQINIGADYARVIDPISLLHGEFLGPSWNRMRTGAAFFAPLDGGTFQTSLYLVCPTSSIQSGGTTFASGAFGGAAGFPDLDPDSAASFGSSDINSGLQGVVFDDKENFLVDIISTCSCLTIRRVTDLATAYADPGKAPNGTYTELFGGTGPTNCAVDTTDAGGCARSFAAYRAIVISDGSLAGGQLDDFGATWNANRASLGGLNPSNITPGR
jgi:hypothetical protein